MSVTKKSRPHMYQRRCLTTRLALLATTADWLVICLPSPCGGFETRSGGSESGLHVDYAHLSVLSFAVSCHEPNEVDGMSWNGHVRVVTVRHAHRIPIAHDTDEVRLLALRVDALDAERRRRHVKEHVELFKHG